ncbi:hypothetical protein FGO68_gene11373 [Halteria grandinella]|uniref:Uncharacterized protein n=1 Tax=Halteria grandinella TaxID=5974 RepID=A0A8J8T1U6_HALGN|nr:hypothetical protein FGO68_gene11373 [Halteria grandinella]
MIIITLALISMLPICKAGGVHVYILSDEDRVNPNYTDVCFEGNNNQPCRYCCIISLSQCSGDNRACQPIQVEKRHLEWMLDMVFFVLGTTMGCQFLQLAIKALIQFRCCKTRFPRTHGVNCVELFLRVFCCLCIDFQRTYKKQDANSEMIGTLPQKEEASGSSMFLLSTSHLLKSSFTSLCTRFCKLKSPSRDTSQPNKLHRRLDSRAHLLKPQESMNSISGFQQDIRAYQAKEAAHTIVDGGQGEAPTMVVHQMDGEDDEEEGIIIKSADVSTGNRLLQVKKMEPKNKSDNLLSIQNSYKKDDSSWRDYDGPSQRRLTTEQPLVQVVTEEEWPETERLLRAKITAQNNKNGFITLKHREGKKDDDPNHGWGVSELSSHVTAEGGDDGTFISQGGRSGVNFQFGAAKRK